MIILTCGTFDLFHIGHLRYFQTIKNKDDTLIVLIHSDKFVKSYKRLPIINENERFEIINSLKIVDNVFIDNNDHVTYEIMKKYKIDMVFHTHPEEQHQSYVEMYQIPIKLGKFTRMEYTSTISTTDIIERVTKRIFSNNKPNQ